MVFMQFGKHYGVLICVNLPSEGRHGVGGKYIRGGEGFGFIAIGLFEMFIERHPLDSFIKHTQVPLFRSLFIHSSEPAIFDILTLQYRSDRCLGNRMCPYNRVFEIDLEEAGEFRVDAVDGVVDAGQLIERGGLVEGDGVEGRHGIMLI